MDIVCLGAANLDIFASPVDRSVFQVQKQHIEEIGLVPGGDAVNQALTLSKFGVHAGLAACVGADEIGEMLLRTLRSRGVDTACTEILPGEPTTVAIVLVGKDGERNIVAKAGAHTKLCRESALRTLTSSVRALSIGSFFSCPEPGSTTERRCFSAPRREKGKIPVLFADRCPRTSADSAFRALPGFCRTSIIFCQAFMTRMYSDRQAGKIRNGRSVFAGRRSACARPLMRRGGLLLSGRCPAGRNPGRSGFAGRYDRRGGYLRCDVPLSDAFGGSAAGGGRICLCGGDAAYADVRCVRFPAQ